MNTLPSAVLGEMCGDIDGGEKGGETNLDNPVCVELSGDVNEDDAGDVLATTADQGLCVGDNIASIAIGGE